MGIFGLNTGYPCSNYFELHSFAAAYSVEEDLGGMKLPGMLLPRRRIRSATERRWLYAALAAAAAQLVTQARSAGVLGQPGRHDRRGLDGSRLPAVVSRSSRKASIAAVPLAGRALATRPSVSRRRKQKALPMLFISHKFLNAML